MLGSDPMRQLFMILFFNSICWEVHPLCLALPYTFGRDDKATQTEKQLKPKAAPRLPATPVNVLAFSADGKLLAIAGSDLRLFELSTGRELGRAAWTSHCRCRHLAFSPDGRRL